MTSAAPRHDHLRVDGARLWARLEALGEIGAFLGPNGDCGNAQLALRSPMKIATPVVVGSHIETVSTGGRFDGNLGVLEVLKTFEQHAVSTAHRAAVGALSPVV